MEGYYFVVVGQFYVYLVCCCVVDVDMIVCGIVGYVELVGDEVLGQCVYLCVGVVFGICG